MLKSIALIGSQTTSDWAYLVDRFNGANVFVICVDDNGKYENVSVEDNEGGERYLYRRDKSGKPGIFLTGKISAQDIKGVKGILLKSCTEQIIDFEALFTENKVQDFVRKKIDWYSFRKRIPDNKYVIANVPEKSRKLLTAILDNVTSNREDIARKLFILISNGNYNSDALITVKIGKAYLSEIDGFALIFKYLSQVGLRPNDGGDNHGNLANCIICNSPASSRHLKEPLRFITFDKPNFSPSGRKENIARALSLCVKCYEHLQMGERYIRTNFDFSVPYTKGATRISFWLVPILNNTEVLNWFMKKPEKGLSSFRNMQNIANDLEGVKKVDSATDMWTNDESLSALLTYSALFYYNDDNDHMRLIEAADGILPSRLSELAVKKFEVDKMDNFRMLFHYGIIQEFFFSASKEDAETTDDFRLLSYVMSSIFTAKKLNAPMIISTLMHKIRQKARKHDSDGVEEITLKAMALLEYLYRVRCLEGKSIEKQDVRVNDDSLYQDAAEFMNVHSALLGTKNLRAICAIGIAAGVVIKAQKALLGSETFMERLNRFEMDYVRLRSIFPAALPKLAHYKATRFSDLFASLGVQEIANLDPNEEVEKETMNLALAIGVCKGFELFNSKQG